MSTTKRIKRIDAGEDTSKIRCPVCGQHLLFQEGNKEGQINPCKHVQIWTTNMDDNTLIFAKNKKIENCYHTLFEQMYESFVPKSKEDDVARRVVQTIYGKNPSAQIIFFDEGYMGGDQFAHSWIAFIA